MGLSKELEKLKFDKRLTEWQVSRGHIAKEDLKKYLDSLPDLASNVEIFSLGDEGSHENNSSNGDGHSY